MAEVVLSPIAKAILEKLGSLLGEEFGLLSGLQNELEKLSMAVKAIEAALRDAETQYSINKHARVWLEMLKDVVYDADDLLDDFATEALRQQVMTGNNMIKEVRLFFSRSNKLAYRIKMAHKIRDISAKLLHIASLREFRLSDNPVDPSFVEVSWRETLSCAPKVVIGRDDDKKEILNLLQSDQGEASAAVIPIVGLGGTGKTALAQDVYNDTVVQRLFEPKLWVCVSDTFSVRLILEKMVESATGKKPKDNGMDTLHKKLCDIINGKKYLLVLDDVWNENRQKWLDFYNLVIGGARGSRIILTTRSREVAEVTNPVSLHELGGLSDIHSWALFQKMAFKQGQAPNENFEVMGRDIVAKCAGLPLAIKTIGSLLYTKGEEYEWQSFKDEELSKLDRELDIVKTLKLSYNHLPSYLKKCFAYCSLFPKDYKFHVPTLISHWTAHGYICPNNQGPSSGNLGLKSFNYLLQRSFFQEVEEKEYGDIEYCKMHDCMHDLAMLVAGKESIQVAPNREAVKENCRHISLLLDGDLSSQWKHKASLVQIRKARTFLAFFHSIDFDTKRDVGRFLSRAIIPKLRCLRVLEINEVSRSLHQLKHLRRLELSNSKIKKLPNCITTLVNLQVLNLDYCRNLKQLPRDTKKLVNLIHFGIENCFELTHMPSGLGQLTSLEVLSRFVLSEPTRQKGLRLNGSSGLNELHGLNNLRGKLRIKDLEVVKNPATECQEVNLKGKPHLQILSLSWSSYDNDLNRSDISSQEMTMEALEPHTNLKELNIDGYGGVEFPKWISSLRNLVKIKFFDCNYCKSLPQLDNLPSLQYLDVVRFKDLEYMDNEVACVGDIEGGGVDPNTSSLIFFPSLKELCLHDCPNLKGWRRRTLTDASGNTTPSTSSSLMDQHFACLSKLVIYDCPNLAWIPLLPSLEDLYLHRSNFKLLLDEEMIQNLGNLKFLKIRGCLNTRALSPWMHHLTSLEHLSVGDTKEMYLLENEDEDEDNTQWQQLINLRYVEFDECWDLRFLPKWLQHVGFLEKLEILDCRKLMRMPEWLANLTSLQHLVICDWYDFSFNLSNSCGSRMGADWSYISHIPNIQVRGKWVQQNGSYVLS